MATITDDLLQRNAAYAAGQPTRVATHPGAQPIKPARGVAVVACMDARLTPDALGVATGDAHWIANAGGVVDASALRSLVISHHLLDTREIVLIKHTRCGMLAFSDALLVAGLHGDEGAVAGLRAATGRAFAPCCRGAHGDAGDGITTFHAFEGDPEPLDAAPTPASLRRLRAEVRRGVAAVKGHPHIPTDGPDAVTVRGFVYDVDTGKLEEVVGGDE